MLQLLAKHPIRNQILLGLFPVMLGLALLSVTSALRFNQFQDQLNLLQQANAQRLSFLETNRNILEHQRLALVYSSVGYSGVLHKINRLESKIANELRLSRAAAVDNEEMAKHIDAMASSYKEYTQLFLRSVETQKSLKLLLNSDIETLHSNSKQILENLDNHYEQNKNHRAIHQSHAVQLALLKIYANAKITSTSAHVVAFEDSLKLLHTAQQLVEKTLSANPTKQAKSLLEQLHTSLEQYDVVLRKLVTTRSAYLQLINVVLAGKTARINQLSSELDSLIANHVKVMRDDILVSMEETKNLFNLFTILAVLVGIATSLIIANSIATPVKAMAATLSKLAAGEPNVNIPGQKREDEVGHMAKAANEFKIMAQDLESQTMELEEFAYRTSHDLRSPLIATLSLLDVTSSALENNNLPQAHQAIEFAKSSLTKLEILIRDILELSKSKNAPEPICKIDLFHLAEEAVAKVENLENAHRLQILNLIPKDINLHSRTSRVRLILENLVSNAIKYQDLDKQRSFVEIRAKQHQDEITIEIEDNGLGIPPEYHHQLFSMFKRFHPKASFGSGLGLYMVQKSVNLLRGKLEFKDQPNGSLFRVTLPISIEDSGPSEKQTR